LLRAVNVGGRNGLSMPTLRQALADDLTVAEIKTYGLSGNIVFTQKTPPPSIGELESTLERAIGILFGLRPDIIIRSAEQWRGIIALNPFTEQASFDPAHLLLMAFKEEPVKDGLDGLADSIQGREKVHCVGSHAYIVYPDGIGRSKLTGAVIERHLGVRGTARNWNTVLKLDGLAAELITP
jgi:uncharacterized protein (DUF1697 family)